MSKLASVWCTLLAPTAAAKSLAELPGMAFDQQWTTIEGDTTKGYAAGQLGVVHVEWGPGSDLAPAKVADGVKARIEQKLAARFPGIRLTSSGALTFGDRAGHELVFASAKADIE